MYIACNKYYRKVDGVNGKWGEVLVLKNMEIVDCHGKKWNINEYYVFVALVDSCQFGGASSEV